MKTLVIAEKKSAAETFATALGGFKATSDVYERHDMVIAWASGHLLGLQQPEEYNSQYREWNLARLPIIPGEFVHQPLKSQTRLLEHLIRLCADKGVLEIVNACDAGREGEVIFHHIHEAACQSAPSVRRKPIKRLWLQSMTHQAIRLAFDNLGDSRCHVGLRDAGLAREIADWLVGINMTRAVTRRFARRNEVPLTVGRVKTPTLSLLVDREREIDGFSPEPFFQIEATFDLPTGKFTGRWKGQDAGGRSTDSLQHKQEAERIREDLAGQNGRVSDQVKRRREQPPQLFDLTTLQRVASRRYGFTLDRTLDTAQRLYANQIITYPRTSSRYLQNDYRCEVSRILGAIADQPIGEKLQEPLASIEIDDALETRNQVFDDAKVTDHFAIIPTGDHSGHLSGDDAKIYELIARRFVAAFLPSAIWEDVERKVHVREHVFTTKVRRLVTEGWRVAEPVSESHPLPPATEGAVVSVRDIDVLEKQTQPPPRYSDGTLVRAMETATANSDSPEAITDLNDAMIDEIAAKGLGTPATRAGILKELIEKKLVRREGKTLLPTGMACTLVRLLRNLDSVLSAPDLTKEWEYGLALVASGEVQRADWEAEIKRHVEDAIASIRGYTGGSDSVLKRDHPATCKLKCPRCQQALVEQMYSYRCIKTNCGFKIGKEQQGKYLFPETVGKLLAQKRTGPLTGFQGTRRPGCLVLRDAKLEVQFSGDEDSVSTDLSPGTVVGACPKCSHHVTCAENGYKCERCDFVLFERIKQKRLSHNNVRRLLGGEWTDSIKGFVDRNGRQFTAKLRFIGPKLEWRFPS